MTQQPINIIGAGIGGLTLARCLSQRGVPAVLYDKVPNSSRHGYGITLHASTYRSLLAALKMDEPTFKRRVAVDAALGGVGTISPTKMVRPEQLGKDSFRAHRARLENLLREDLDIRWDSGVEKLEHTTSTNIISFRDGHRVETGCTICMDGVHSNARKSLLSRSELNILPFVTFNGKRRVKRDEFEKIFAPAMKDTTIVEKQKGDALLQISLNDIAEQVSISWIYSRKARGANDTLYMPNRPLSGASDIPEDFFAEIESLTSLDQPFKDVFDVNKLRNDRILSWLMRTVQLKAKDLEGLAQNNIFLLGDAAHAQPILGGEGANAAINDALELSEVIATSGVEAVPEWYKSRLPIWKQRVEQSKKQIDALHVIA